MVSFLQTPANIFYAEELKFAEANGCIDCVSQAYQMFPNMNWVEFCAAFGESKTVRSSWEIGSKIASGKMEQPFLVRGSINETSEIGVLLEKKFLALTTDECMSLFKLPPESLDGAKSVTIINEENEKITFWLFTDDSSYRVATFFSKHNVAHQSHLLEKHKMLRKEQPAERYSCLCKDDIAARKQMAVMSLSAAKSQAESLIEARIKQEERQSQELANTKPSEMADIEVEGLMAPIAKLELSGTAGTSAKPNDKPGKKAKAKATPKTPPVKKRRAGAGAGGATRAPFKRTSSPTPSFAQSGRESVGGRPSSAGGGDGEEDELATAIQTKLKCDPKSVSSMNVQRALQGEQLGRSIVGVSWFQRYQTIFKPYLFLESQSLGFRFLDIDHQPSVHSTQYSVLVTPSSSLTLHRI